MFDSAQKSDDNKINPFGVLKLDIKQTAKYSVCTVVASAVISGKRAL